MAARTRASSINSFYIVNAILVKGTAQVAEALAARPDVARVEGNPHIQNQLPQPGPSVDAPPHSSVRTRSSRASITRTRRRCGPWDSPGRTSLLPVPTLAFAGPTMR